MLRDDLNRNIEGAFYEQELLKTKYDDFLIVDKVLQEKGGKSLVEWWGFDDERNQCIPSSDIRETNILHSAHL